MVLEKNGGRARVEPAGASESERIGQSKRRGGGGGRSGKTEGLHLGCWDRGGKKDREMGRPRKEERTCRRLCVGCQNYEREVEREMRYEGEELRRASGIREEQESIILEAKISEPWGFSTPMEDLQLR